MMSARIAFARAPKIFSPELRFGTLQIPRVSSSCNALTDPSSSSHTPSKISINRSSDTLYEMRFPYRFPVESNRPRISTTFCDADSESCESFLESSLATARHALHLASMACACGTEANARNPRRRRIDDARRIVGTTVKTACHTDVLMDLDCSSSSSSTRRIDR